MKEILATLAHLGACWSARQWAFTLPEDTTFRQAWEACPRGDWLLWLAQEVGVDHKLIVSAGCACAKVSVSPEDTDSRAALALVEGWVRGEDNNQELRRMHSADWCANENFATSSAVATIFDASYADDTANWPEDREWPEERRKELRAQLADTVRSLIPFEEIEKCLP